MLAGTPLQRMQASRVVGDLRRFRVRRADMSSSSPPPRGRARCSCCCSRTTRSEANLNLNRSKLNNCCSFQRPSERRLFGSSQCQRGFTGSWQGFSTVYTSRFPSSLSLVPAIHFPGNGFLKSHFFVQPHQLLRDTSNGNAIDEPSARGWRLRFIDD